MIGLALTLDLLGAPALLGELEFGRLPSLWATLALAYLGTGAALAWHLSRKGHGLGTVTSALGCWPLLLGLIGRPAPRGDLRAEFGAEFGSGRDHAGPNLARIDACMRALAEGLAETVDAGGSALIDAVQLGKLRAALHRADGRIARVDRLLLDTQALHGSVDGGLDECLDRGLAQLRGAREHAHRELEAVLTGLIQLRVQLGLFTLAGESEPVRERLAELEARVAALAELSSVEFVQARS